MSPEASPVQKPPGGAPCLSQHESFQAGIPLLCLQSTVCEKIMELLGQNEVEQRQRKVVILSQDRFYKVLTAEQKAKALKGQYNFDHPGTSRAQRCGEGRPHSGRPLTSCAWVQGWMDADPLGLFPPAPHTACSGVGCTVKSGKLCRVLWAQGVPTGAWLEPVRKPVAPWGALPCHSCDPGEILPSSLPTLRPSGPSTHTSAGCGPSFPSPALGQSP